MQHTAAQQIEHGSAVHLAFEQHEPRNLLLDLPWLQGRVRAAVTAAAFRLTLLPIP